MEESKKISEVSQEDSVTKVGDLGNPFRSDQLLTRKFTFGPYVFRRTLYEDRRVKIMCGLKSDKGELIAIRIYRRDTSDSQQASSVHLENAIQSSINHDNIQRLFEMIHYKNHICLVLQYPSRGTLLDYISSRKMLKEGTARRFFRQLLDAIEYLQFVRVIHHNLNLRTLQVDKDGNIVMTDFSMAGTFNAKNKPTKAMERGSNNREFIALFNLAQADEHGKLRGACLENPESLLPYTGPELLKYDDMYTGPWVDVWSCGIILYAMLCGSLPFHDDSMNPMGDNIIMLKNYINSTPLTFPSHVTSSARKLISAMLEPELRKRIGVRGVQVGPWHRGY
ncbi:kinase-like protein [Lophium mytilinum]|uniref:Kinase-like protein n=1 Tax=Lophium mytilinum TaxID=390894 RepID=A0A6A6QRG4_9PEZI|nr:kinase-like protein [Lophium mytilinum]